MKKIRLIKMCRVRRVELPDKGHLTDAGIDFYMPDLAVRQNIVDIKAANPDFWDIDDIIGMTESGRPFLVLPPHTHIKIPSGIKVALNEEAGEVLIITNKSGIATKKGLIVGADTIDSSYRGEIHIHLMNVSKNSARLESSSKIAQGILYEIPITDVKEIPSTVFDTLYNDTSRGSGAFGSTGLTKRRG